MGSRRPKEVDYLRVYPGLNDLGDALEALPVELVQYITMFKEIDAKNYDGPAKLEEDIHMFLEEHNQGHTHSEQLTGIRDQLVDLLPCLEEKMRVAGLAADAMSRHIDRLDADFTMICDNEIPANVQKNLDDPAFMQPAAPDKGPNHHRSNARREAIAAKRAAVAASNTATASEVSRSSTPTGRGRGRRAATPQVPPPAAPTETEEPEPKRRHVERQEQENEEKGPVQLPSRRSKGEPVYCYCGKGSFGDMVGCDGSDCKREWFHLGCIGLSAPPKGQWFCEECQAKLRRR